jgi:hypothetical protein
MPQSLEFDERAWPLLIARLPTAIDMPSLNEIIKGFDRIFDRRERYACVVDLTAITRFPGTAERARLSEWLGDEDRMAKEKAYAIANAVVLTSGPARALLTAINWVRRPATTQVWKASEAEAVEWCCEQMLAKGMKLSPAVGSLRAQAAKRDRESSRAPR